MRVINGIVFSNLEINVIYLRDEKHLSSAKDICNHLRNVNVEEIEYLLVLLKNHSIVFS